MDDIAMKPPEPVLRQDGVALWRQIANRLQHDIGAGIYPPGGRLPTEAELSQQFRVNRHTVRRALEELSRGGLVRVEQGRGSFVAEDVLEYAVEARTRFSEWIRRHNKEPSGRLLQLKETAADSHVAAGLGIRAGGAGRAAGAAGLRRRPAGQPGAALFPCRQAARRARRVARRAHHHRGAEGGRRLRLSAPDSPASPRGCRTRRRRNCCACRATGPLLVTENINVDRAGMVVEFGISRYPTPRVQIVFEP